jgi:hypothetical protein
MHCRIALAVCLPMALAAHSDASAQSMRTRALVRSADSTQQVAMQVQLTGSLFASLGPARLPRGGACGGGRALRRWTRDGHDPSGARGE